MRVRTLVAFVASKTLTAWLVGVFILYYLTVAVWGREAFASFVGLLSDNLLFRAAHLLLVANVAVRSLRAVAALRRHRVMLLLRLPLYAGLLLFLLSFFLSVNMRQGVRLIIGEGDVVEFPWEGMPYRVLAVAPALEKRTLRTDERRIFDYEPGLTVVDRRGVRHRIGAFPPTALGSSYVHVLNFGIGPGVTLRKNGETVAGGYMALQLTPFGRVDRFELRPWPYVFYLSILPNRTVTKGKETGRDYDLTRPRYRVEVVKGDRTIAEGETDDAISFDGGMSLSFFAPSDWVLLEAASDPFLPFFAASLVLLVAGVVLYPFSFFGAASGVRKAE